MRTIKLEEANEERSFFEKHGLWKGLGIIRRYIWYNTFLKEIRKKKWFKVNNYKLPIDFKVDIISKGLYIKGSREILETEIMKREIKEGDTCLEAGANIGYYAFLESKVPNTKVFAFEPDPRNIKLLNEGIRKNKLNNIFFYPDALSNTIGQEDFYLSKESNVNSMVKTERATGEVLKVKTTTIDNFSIGRKIDLIRMDIEGFEVEVFKGMKNLIESDKKLRIMVEFHADKYSEERDFTKELIKLEENKFKCKYIVTQERPLIQIMGELGYKPEIIVNDSPNTRALYKNVKIKDVCNLIKRGNLLRAGFFER